MEEKRIQNGRAKGPEGKRRVSTAAPGQHGSACRAFVQKLHCLGLPGCKPRPSPDERRAGPGRGRILITPT